MNQASIPIFPSIMCSKPWEVKDYLAAFEETGIRAVHFDVMDGHYVPNIMLDSGAFSAWYHKDTIAIRDYMAFIEKHAGRFCSIVALDKIPGEKMQMAKTPATCGEQRLHSPALSVNSTSKPCRCPQAWQSSTLETK